LLFKPKYRQGFINATIFKKYFQKVS
jgi:hypothetical protein